MMIEVEAIHNQQEIEDIFQWCDRWCDKCVNTGACSLFKSSATVTPEDILESLPKFFETAKKMLQDMLEKRMVDPDTLTEADFEDEYSWKSHLLRNDERVVMASKYRKRVTKWFDSLNNDYGTELRMTEHVLSDCIDVIIWYQHMFEIKIKRALIAQDEEREMNEAPRDSIGNAKLLLVCVDKSISAWGHVYQKFQEDEDEILAILICLQNIGKKIEQAFPDARAFIRPGLDE